MKNPELTRKLFEAMLVDDIDTAKEIITQNKNMNLNEAHPDKAGIYTPLIASIEFGCIDTFLYLINQGARVSISIGDENNKMPLAYAASSANSDFYVRSLLPLNPSVNHRDMDGKTAIYHAIVKARPILQLVEHGGDVTIPDNDGNIPLDVAIRSNYPKVATQLFCFTLSSPKLNNPKAFIDKYNKSINQDDVILWNHNFIATTKDRFEKIRLLQGALSQSTPFGWYLHNLKTEKAFEAKKLLQSNLEKLLEATRYNQFIEEQNKPVQSPVFNAYQQTGAQPTLESLLKRLDEQDQRILALEEEVKRLSAKQGNMNKI